MSYTVKKLAALSGVSIRTLHYYDEIGLLKPAFIGENHYRHYEEEQLLRLQQILFYRELDVSLKDIQSILESSEFNKITALKSHRAQLEKQLARKHALLKTVDNTIAHLSGRKKMSHKDLYYGFDSEKQRAYEQELIEMGVCTEESIAQCRERAKDMTEEDLAKFQEKCDKEMSHLASLLENGLQPEDKEAQEVASFIYDWCNNFWTPDKERFIGLGQMYCTHPDFRKFYMAYHPKLHILLRDAMKLYAEQNL